MTITLTLTDYHFPLLLYVPCSQNYSLTMKLKLHEHKLQLLLVQQQRLKRQPLECIHQNQMRKNSSKRTPEYNRQTDLLWNSDTIIINCSLGELFLEEKIFFFQKLSKLTKNVIHQHKLKTNTHQDLLL